MLSDAHDSAAAAADPDLSFLMVRGGSGMHPSAYLHMQQVVAAMLGLVFGALACLLCSPASLPPQPPLACAIWHLGCIKLVCVDSAEHVAARLVVRHGII